MTTNTFPQLRFSGFTEKLSDKRLGDVFKLFNGYAFKSNDASSSGTRWLKIADVGVRGMTPNAPSFLPKEFSEKHEKFKVRKGDFVVALTRPILSHELKIAKVDDVYDGSLLNQRVGKLISDENLDYVYQLLQCSHVIFDIENRIDGTDPPNLSPNEIKGIKCRVHPSSEEQQKIADFLSSVDKKISLLKEKHALLTQYKKGVMQKLFKQEIRFKDDNGNDYPDWQEQRFEQVFERVTRKNKEDNQNVLTISAQRGLINQEKYFNKSVSAKDVTGYYLLEKGDFAYNKSYSKGYPMGAIKRLNNYDKGVVSTLYICFKSHGEQHDEFWEQYFEAGNLNREINKIAQEGARNHGLLNVSVTEFFHDVKVVAPCAEEQQKIADFLQALDKKLDAVNQQIELTQTFKKGLLQQMFV